MIHSWWMQYLAGIIGVSTLGASITFGVLTTSSSDPLRRAENGSESSLSRFGDSTVKNFLAIAFLLFLITIGFGNLIYSLLIFYQKEYFADSESFRRKIGSMKLISFNRLLHLLNLILTSTMLAAFIFLALVTVAFAKVVGWVILGFVCFYWIIYFIIWWRQW